MSRVLVALSATSPPLDPTAREARDQLLHELSKAVYQSARPTLLEIIEKALSDWFASLNPQGAALGGAAAPVVIVVIVVVALAVAFLIFGVPRLNRRAAAVGSLFGREDARDSQELRAAAERAAAAGDYATAIEEQFRAIARALAERTVVVTFPGATAHGFAEQAAESFPAFHVGLRAAADSFDGVRYLGTAGTEAQWNALRTLDDDLRAARPLLEVAPA